MCATFPIRKSRWNESPSNRSLWSKSTCYNIHNLLRQLRCTDQCLLKVPLTPLKYAGDRSFQKAAPMLYNALPVTIKTAPSLSVFKKGLKRYSCLQKHAWYRFINVRLFRLVMHLWVTILSDIQSNINCLLYYILYIACTSEWWL